MNRDSKAQRSQRRAGALTMVAGGLFVAGGVVAWRVISKVLRDEKIVLPPNAPILAGQEVQDPITAYVEAGLIRGNAERGSGGRTYAEISEALKDAPKGSDEERELRAQSATLATAASLRASLMTSVLAYGVSALIVGLGVMFLQVGAAFRKSGR